MHASVCAPNLTTDLEAIPEMNVGIAWILRGAGDHLGSIQNLVK